MKNLATVEIEKIVYGGQGLGRAGGKIVFVPFTAPGDRVTAAIFREKKTYIEGTLQAIVNPSARRIQPFCGVFGRCGGCQLQHLPYADQISIKEENLRDSLHRLRRKQDFEILPTLAAPQDRGYRIRTQLKGALVGGRAELGFYGIRSHRIVEIDECPLLHPLAGEILHEFRKRVGRGEGTVRMQMVEILVSPEEAKGIIRVTGSGSGVLKALKDLIQESPVLKGAILETKVKTTWGKLLLRFRLPGDSAQESVEVDIPADSFFQVNPFQNRNLIRVVREWAALTGREKVLDLFCGAGNLTLPLARKAGKIWGVDSDPTAVSAAEENARKNGLGNCSFRAATAEAGAAWVSAEANRVDLIVLDPPRAGAAECLEPMVRLCPQKILYVSCEPPTLGRDLARLEELGYRVTRLQPLDMFPHTYHLEVVAELVRA